MTTLVDTHKKNYNHAFFSHVCSCCVFYFFLSLLNVLKLGKNIVIKLLYWLLYLLSNVKKHEVTNMILLLVKEINKKQWKVLCKHLSVFICQCFLVCWSQLGAITAGYRSGLQWLDHSEKTQRLRYVLVETENRNKDAQSFHSNKGFAMHWQWDNWTLGPHSFHNDIGSTAIGSEGLKQPEDFNHKSVSKVHRIWPHAR